MNQEEEVRVRRSVEFDEDLLLAVRKMAKDKNWSFSYTGYVLLQSAIKEKQRKKKRHE